MINKTINEINKCLTALFEKVPGVKIYGLAQTLIRKQGTEQEQIPALVDNKGEGQYVGIDDKSPVIIYHKTNSIVSNVGAGGYGDNKGRLINNYQQSLIVYLDRRKLNLWPDELVMYIQAYFPDRVQDKDFEISIKFQNVVLSSTQTYANEYRKDYSLPPEVSLFTVNYIVESSFKKNCFEKCINC